MKPQIKAVLFDKDGTLFHFADTWEAWVERLLPDLAPDDLKLQRQLADVAGYDMVSKTFVPGAFVVNAAAEEVNDAWAALIPDMDVAEIEAIGIKHLEDLPLAPVCDLKDFVAQLKTLGLKVGVATNDFEKGAQLQLGAMGVLEDFDFVCGFDSGYGSKPGPGMILGFAKQVGVAPSEVAMVGDSTHDLHAGRAAKVGQRIGVLTGPATYSDIAKDADVVLQDITKIPAYLRSCDGDLPK